MQKKALLENGSISSQKNNILTVNLVVGNVIFSFHEESLKILLVKKSGTQRWMLPWNFVYLEEGADMTAHKLIRERTNSNHFYTSQFHLFGKYDRFDFEKHCEILTMLGYDPEGDHSFLRYTAFMGYYTFVRYEDVDINVDSKVEKVKWFEIDKIPSLYFEHNEVVEKSLCSVKQRIGYLPLGYMLLPEKFTMPELRLIYEAFLRHDLDRRNFQRKMLSTGLIRKLNEKKKKGAHKSPYLYSFDNEKYETAIQNGDQLMA